MRKLLGAVLLLATVTCCGGAVPNAAVPTPLAEVRGRGRSSSDPEELGRWALAEMLAPGGDAKEATTARKKLDRGAGLYASLARALYDEAHGEPKTAADAYVATLEAARDSRDPGAALAAWFSGHHLLGLRGSVSELYARYRPRIERIAQSPGALGWRTVAELNEWIVAEAFDKAEVTGDAYDKMVATRMGCATSLRLAGPFGRGSGADRRRPFAAEQPGPWPAAWPADKSRGTAPHVLKSEQHRCLIASTERAEEGVYYVETFVTADAERDVILAVQGAAKVWIDDAPVAERDLRIWGVWQRFGARVRLGAGRHRVLARVLGDSSSVRVVNADGTPAQLHYDVDASRAYSLAAPRVLPDPNPIDAIVGEGHASSPLLAALASYAAYVEAMSDVASVLIEPIVVPEDAAAVALTLAAGFARGDSALPDDMRQRSERELHARAVKKDPRLWYSRAWLILDEAEQRGAIEAIEPMRKLVAEFPGEPEIVVQLARVYGKLGWRAERMRALEDLAQRFPDDVNALRLYSSALEEDGTLAAGDLVAARVKKLDPDAEVDLDRALARHDWKAAQAELARLAKRRPDRKELAAKIADVLARAGDPSAAAAQLDKALAKNPEDSAARLRLADRAYARGDLGALRRALAEALAAGGKGVEIHEALDLLDGASNMEPYRMDGRKVVREFEAWEKRGKRMEGNAARVLDYSAIWVHPDGSSEMLEHEILKIQSQEAIGKESEQEPPTGLILRLRVLKPDGSTLEPEPVSGKPTLTMPHLEVGDYIEIEHITLQAGDGQRGKRYRGPHWFFREADKGYWRSEFVCITPKDRKVDIETLGQVGAPIVRDKGTTFIERRWRVDESPPVVDEPDSAPPVEFLPSIRVGWGISLDDSVERLVDVAVDETPLDPRVKKRALEIVRGIPEKAKDDRARAAYKHVLDHIEDGPETDGRRVLLGRVGSRKSAFEHLMRQLGIPIELALVKNRLAMPPLGKMSEVEQYDNMALRIETEHGPRWLTVRDKFAPYGYVPAEMRGQPAIRLVAGTPTDVVTNTGALDGIVFEGRADLREDGSATVELAQSFTGKVGITMRNVFDKIPETQVREFVETRLLARNLPGARLRDVKIENKQDLGEPLIVRTHAEVAQLARPQGKGLVLRALFPMRIAQLAALPSRQTPLLLGSSSHAEVRFVIVVPESMRVPASLSVAPVKDGERIVLVRDTVHGHAVTLDRVIDIPAGRVLPGDEYTKFQAFAQAADAAVERDVMLGL